MKIFLVSTSPNLGEENTKIISSFGEYREVKASKLTEQELIEKVGDVDFLIIGPSGVEKIGKTALDGLKNLKLISTLSVGTSWIDLDYARKKGVSVSNTKGSNSQSVAEHVWGMILSLTKRITEADRDVREKQAHKFHDYAGLEISGKTLGIIGLGEIGSRVAKIGKAFDMKILGINRSKKNIDGVEIVDLDTLLSESDIISVNTPLNPETENLVSSKEIEKMKDGVILINCSREEVVDKSAVLNGLSSGKIGGYGLDMNIMKKIEKDDPYLDFPNVILTPHSAWYTKEAYSNENRIAVENIVRFIEGYPQNVVN